MINKIRYHCNNTESIYGILNLYKNELLSSYDHLSFEERKVAARALPYVYRMWYYSTMVESTSLSPANFINMQIKERFGGTQSVVPISSTIQNNNKITGLKYEYKLFDIENHPVLNDLEQFLYNCVPDIGVDESGLILDSEREKFIKKMTFKEIFYITFLTNMSYELGLLKKLPSINTYRAAAIPSSSEAFFNLSKREQLQKIVNSTITNASKQLSEKFVYGKKAFSAASLGNLIKDGIDLNEYLDSTLKKFGFDFASIKLGDLMIGLDDDMDTPSLNAETVRIVATRMDLAFYLEAFLITPLGYYLQLIQPIFINSFDINEYLYQLLEGHRAGIPLIKLFFPMVNGFDVTVLGKKLLLGNAPPKHSFQSIVDTVDLSQIYKDIVNHHPDVLSFENLSKN